MTTALSLSITAADAAVTVGTGTKKAATLAATAGTATQVVKVTAASPASPLQMTDGAGTTDGTAISWYSDPLNAVTISGAISWAIATQEDAAQANTALCIRVERCAFDGTVVSTILAETVNQGAGEMGTTQAADASVGTLTPTSTTLADTDRLRITLWIDSATHQGGSGSMATGHWGKAFYNASAATGNAKVTFTEALTQFTAWTSSGSDNAVATDTVTSSIVVARAANDSAVATDAATGVVPHRAADNAAATDSVVRSVILFVRSAADASAGTDAVARLLTVTRTSSDALGGTDAATRLVAKPRVGSDSAPAADIATRLAASILRSVSDSEPATDGATRSVREARTLADTAATTDVATRKASLSRSSSDTAPAADIAARLAQALARAASDAEPATDSPVRSLQLARTATDSAPAADVAAGGNAPSTVTVDLYDHGVFITHLASGVTITADTILDYTFDASLLSDPSGAGVEVRLSAIRIDVGSIEFQALTTIPGPQSFTRTGSDSAPATDIAIRIIAQVRLAVDMAGLTDQANRLIALRATATDSEPATDAAVTPQTRITADSAPAIDATLRQLALIRQALDSALLSDLARGTLRVDRFSVDTAAAVDTAVPHVVPFSLPGELVTSTQLINSAGPGSSSASVNGTTTNPNSVVGNVSSGTIATQTTSATVEVSA